MTTILSLSVCQKPAVGQSSIDLASAQSAWNFARSYKAAADVLLEKLEPNIFIPTLYLLCHSLELSLKTFLLMRGFKEDLLKAKYGHDLNKLLCTVELDSFAKLITLSDEEKRWINAVNKYYSKKHLEYFVPIAKQFPHLERLKNLIERVIHAVGEYVLGESLRSISEQ